MKKIMMLITLMLLWGCDDGTSSSSFDCKSCDDAYRQCNTDSTACEIKDGMCGANNDCTDTAKPNCNTTTHLCEAQNTFDCNSCDSSYQQCNTDSTACELKAGKCNTKDDCAAEKPVCDETHTCIAEVVFNCETCKEWEVCNLENTACILAEDRCNSNTDCADQAENKECDTVAHTCIKPSVKTIYPIQSGAIDAKTVVTVTGTVTAMVPGYGLWLQEPGTVYSGIFVYENNIEDRNAKTGDLVTLTGTYIEYYYLSEIKDITNFSKSAGTAITTYPEFKAADFEIKANAEPYEGVLAEVKGDLIIGDTVSGITTIYYNAEKTKSFEVRNDIFDHSFDKNTKVVAIRGIVHSKSDAFFLLPRTDEDFTDYNAVCAAVTCGENEVCAVIDNVASCVCDEENGYFDQNGSCITPCEADSCGNIENKSCIATSTTGFTCECDRGYQLEEDGTCTKIPLSEGCLLPIYDDIFAQDIRGVALINALNIITGNNYNSLGYDGARDYMYDTLDNENGKNMCVYTGEYTSVNCEHSWPQSQGATGDAKADIHHLFPTDGGVNSARGAYPFGVVVSEEPDIYGADDSTPDYYSKRGLDYRGNTVFEPADQHKGDLARALFYFAVRYGNRSGFLTSQKQDLLNWHNADPVSQKEHDRNDGIEKVQNNRNPFVDCPEFIDRIDVMHVDFPQYN